VDLSLLDDAVEARRARWAAAGVTWEIVRGLATNKPSTSLRAEAPTAVAELTLWVSGEADLTHAGLVPAITEPSVQQYEITSEIGLARCLNDFETLLGIRR
jgi:hypothetical protein